MSMTPGPSASSSSLSSSAQFGSPLTYDSFWSSHSSSVGAYGLRGLNTTGVGTAGSSFTGARGGPLDPGMARFGGTSVGATSQVGGGGGGGNT